MKTRFFSILVLACLVLSCSGSDDDGPGNGTESFIVIKDGQSFTGTNLNNTLINVPQQVHNGKRLDLRCDFDGGTFILSISNWEWQNAPADGVIEKSYNTNTEMGPDTACQVVQSVNYCDEALVTYLVGNDVFISEFLDIEDIGTITITNNDAGDKKVSGTFDVDLRDFNGGIPEVAIPFTGTFENLSYTVF